jgi:hypothetical protein
MINATSAVNALQHAKAAHAAKPEPAHDSAGGQAQKADHQGGNKAERHTDVANAKHRSSSDWHNHLLQHPQDRDAVYEHLRRTDPGLIHHVDKLQHETREARGTHDLRALPDRNEQVRPLPAQPRQPSELRDALERLLPPKPHWITLPSYTGQPRPEVVPLPQPYPREPVKTVPFGDAAASAVAAGAAAGAAAAQTPATPAELASADADAVQQTYDDTLARTGNAARAAEAASQQINTLTAQHEGDTVYTSTLLRESQDTLEQIGDVLGRHVEGEFRGNDADKQSIKNTITSLNGAAENSGAFGAALIADPLARHIPDGDDLHQIDDAFYDLIDDGGSTLLFESLHASLEAQGKHDAAEELLDKGGGFFDAIKDRIGDAVDFVGGVIGTAVDGVVSIASGAANLAVDVAKGTVDVVEGGADALRDGVEFAVKNGLKLSGKLLDWAVDQYRSGLDAATGLSEHVAELGVGDSYELSIDAEAAVLLGIQAGRGVTVTRTQDGYEISGYANGSLGITLGGSVSAGAEGKVTFQAETAEEAQQLALLLASGPKTDEAGLVLEHLSSVELSGSAGIGAELASLGIGELNSELSAAAGVQGSYRLEFENGKPVALVVSQTLSAEGTAAANGQLSPELRVLQELARKAGVELPISGAANGQFEATFETRIPLGDLGDAAGELSEGDLLDAARAGVAHAEQSLHIEGQVSLGENTGEQSGKKISLDIQGIDAGDVRQLAQFITSGDPSKLRGLDLDISGWLADFSYEDHSPVDFAFSIPGVDWGGSLSTESSVTDVDYAHRQRIG